MRPITIITGGSRGIGAATALWLARAGHDLALCYRGNHSGAEKVAAEVTGHGGRCVLVRADIHAGAGVPERLETAVSRVPMGRAGEPEDIAPAIGWLLGPESAYTSGAVLRVAGGL
ncbi:SDR family oxidoreductase [Saccharopolyspora sp. NPDC002376]